MIAYAELATATNFSFLRGASSAQDLVLTALLLGHNGIGIADRNTVAGVVKAYRTLRDLREEGLPEPEKVREGSGPGEFTWIENPVWKKIGMSAPELKAKAAAFKYVAGSRLIFSDGSPEIIVYPQTREGWGRLCRILTNGNMRSEMKGECHLVLNDLISDTRDLLLIVIPGQTFDRLLQTLQNLNEAAPGSVWLGASMHRQGKDKRRLAGLSKIAGTAGVGIVAINDVLYATHEQRDLQDVVTCIREGMAIEKAGRLLEANAERHLKAPEEVARLFTRHPEALGETQHILGRISFSLDDLKYEYPEEPVPPGWTPQGWLEELVRRRAPLRYPGGVPEKVQKLLDRELALIEQLDYARYFLTITQIVDFAGNEGILCQGRGSAANSAVCFVLGITAVNPGDHELLFDRFISSERREPPDIDVDFEHERREEVIQHIYEKYGRHRAGIAATVIHYRPRSAIRDVGKVLGLTEDVTARLADTQWGSWGDGIGDAHIRQAGLDPENPIIKRAVGLALRLLGFPRHVSQHVGGFVLARDRLDELVPIGWAAMEDRTFIEWDKDDIDTLRLMKVDVLALGMLTCIRKAFDYLRERNGTDLTLDSVPPDDTATYDMLCKGESLGVFQVESRAQMNMLPRLRPRKLYDLVIQVAIVRPGPIQGDMVHPYLKRRNGEERVVYPSPAPPHPADELHDVLKETFGVPLFQEQAMKLAMVAAEFTPEQANGLRRAMATFRNVGTMWKYEKLMIEGMVRRGYEPDYARRCFEQIKGFGSYGFPESHAASFAKLVYISAWLKCHYPAVFACALLNSQPMGFYAPAQIVREAQEHGVEVRAIDVNCSLWNNTLEAGGNTKTTALRLGLRQIGGFQEEWAERLEARRNGGYSDIESLRRRTNLPARALRLLADADAFRSIELDRRDALWEVRRLPDDAPLPLFESAKAGELGDEASSFLPAMPLSEHIAADYQVTRLSLKGHPMQILRPLFRTEGIRSCLDTSQLPDGATVRTAGVVLVRQRPGQGTAIFITMEDETGITNVVLWARQFEHFRREVMSARLLVVEGKVQRSKENVVHLMAQRVFDRSAELKRLSGDHSAEMEISRAGVFQHLQYPRAHHPRNVRILPKSRDFH